MSRQGNCCALFPKGTVVGFAHGCFALGGFDFGEFRLVILVLSCFDLQELCFHYHIITYTMLQNAWLVNAKSDMIIE